jgi:hypothetical protein
LILEGFDLFGESPDPVLILLQGSLVLGVEIIDLLLVVPLDRGNYIRDIRLLVLLFGVSGLLEVVQGGLKLPQTVSEICLGLVSLLL